MAHDPRSRFVETDPAFDAFAAREPFFAVITDPEYRSHGITGEARQRFFADGEAIVDALFHTIALRLDPHFAPTSVLEYGCGVGRLAMPLARRSARRGGTLTAVDRSAAMLGHARAHALAEGVTNIEFSSTGDLWRTGLRRFDLVTSYLVLQRMSPDEGLALIRALLETMLPGAIGVFQFPIASRVAPVTRAVRRARELSPVVNRLVQWFRRDALRSPFVPSHVYQLNDVLGVFRDAGLKATHVVFDEHGDLDSAIAIVSAPDAGYGRGQSSADVENGTGQREAEAVIDVADVIARTPIEVLNEAAERYFGSLADWDHHLAKPFASADEAPSLLADAAVVLRGLDLHPGLTVLDFGGGTGWLSRALTQLGCRAILLDVAPTALAMARALYTRLPVVGNQPAPSFLLFDGRAIALPDLSVDRIVCFHAFHHAPNPYEVIAEFGRVLRPGGVVMFAEPGRTHSRTPKSQFEMRSFQVVENDVDVHRVWDEARRHGFTAIRMYATNGEPLELALADYDDLCRGGATSDVWSRETRRYLRNVSNFKLIKQESAPLTSQTAQGLAAVIHMRKGVLTGRAGQPTSVVLRVTNSGVTTWLPPGADAGGVSVGFRIFDRLGALLAATVSSRALTDPARPIAPGEIVDCQVDVPACAAGTYRLELDCVASGVTWFAQAGSHPAVATLEVR